MQDWLNLNSHEKRALGAIVLGIRLITGILSIFWSSMGNTQYLALLVSSAISLAIVFFIFQLCQRYQAPLHVALRLALGKYVYALYCVIVILFLLHSAQNALYISTVLSLNIALPNARLYLIAGVTALAAFLVALAGLRPIARFSKLISYALIAELALTFILMFSTSSFVHFFPFWGTGAGNIVRCGASATTDFFMLFLLGCMYDPAKGKKDGRKLLFIPWGVATGVSFLFYVGATMIFPYTVHSFSPLIEMFSGSNASPSLASIFIFVWDIAFMITLSAQLCFCTAFIGQLIPRIPYSRVVLFAVTAVVFSLSLISRDTLSGFIQTFLHPSLYSWLFLYAPLFLAYLASFFRKDKKACVAS